MILVGKVIRAFRIQKQLSLKELAQKIDLSYSYLSQIENDQVNINLSILESISNALDIPIHMLFLQDSLNDVSLVRANERITMQRADGVTMEMLTKKNVKLDIQIVTYQAGYIAEEFATHQGDEFLMILEGSITINHANYQNFELEKGDCIAFSSRIPHLISSKNGAKVLFHSTTMPIAYA